MVFFSHEHRLVRPMLMLWLFCFVPQVSLVGGWVIIQTEPGLPISLVSYLVRWSSSPNFSRKLPLLGLYQKKLIKMISSWPCSLQNCEQNELLCFIKQPNLGIFIIAIKKTLLYSPNPQDSWSGTQIFGSEFSDSLLCIRIVAKVDFCNTTPWKNEKLPDLFE